MSSKKGFTLIELLVVIAIIGLLSSVVLASLSASRDKGRIAAGLQFSSSLLRTIGDTTEGRWGFDEGSGTLARDFTNLHNVTFTGSPLPTWTTDTPSGDGYAVTLASGGYLAPAGTVSTNGSPNITLSAWIKTTSATTQPVLSLRAGVSSPGDVFFGINGGKAYAYLNYTSGGLNSMLSTVDVNDGKWHHIAWTGNGTKSVLYVDGTISATLTRTNNAVAPVTAYIGRDAQVAPTFVGSVDDVAFFKKTMIASEVKELYLARVDEMNARE